MFDLRVNPPTTITHFMKKKNTLGMKHIGRRNTTYPNAWNKKKYSLIFKNEINLT